MGETNNVLALMSGIAVALAESITSSFMILVMLIIWKKHIILVIIYVVCIMSVELLYLSSLLYKFPHGGYFPIAFASVFLVVMAIWNYVYRKKYYYETENKVSPNTLKDVANQSNCSRIPGLAIFYSKLVDGIPPIFGHYVDNIPALHSVLVFASVKSLPVSTVPPEERFLFRRVYPKELYVFRCVVRYGYTDARNEEEPFERMLIEQLKEFMRDDFRFQAQMEHSPPRVENEMEDDQSDITHDNGALEREIEVVDKALKAGVVHMMGESEVMANKGAGIGKKIVIDTVFSILKRNLRASDKMFDIPRKRLIKIGMTYEL